MSNPPIPPLTPPTPPLTPPNPPNPSDVGVHVLCVGGLNIDSAFRRLAINGTISEFEARIDMETLSLCLLGKPMDDTSVLSMKLQVQAVGANGDAGCVFQIDHSPSFTSVVTVPIVPPTQKLQFSLVSSTFSVDFKTYTVVYQTCVDTANSHCTSPSSHVNPLSVVLVKAMSENGTPVTVKESGTCSGITLCCQRWAVLADIGSRECVHKRVYAYMQIKNSTQTIAASDASTYAVQIDIGACRPHVDLYKGDVEPSMELRLYSEPSMSKEVEVIPDGMQTYGQIEIIADKRVCDYYKLTVTKMIQCCGDSHRVCDLYQTIYDKRARYNGEPLFNSTVIPLNDTNCVSQAKFSFYPRLFTGFRTCALRVFYDIDRVPRFAVGTLVRDSRSNFFGTKTKPFTLSCREGFVLYSGVCISNEECETYQNYAVVDGLCAPSKCPLGSKLVKGVCVQSFAKKGDDAAICPEGTTLKNGVCVKVIQTPTKNAGCPPGSVLNGNMCVSIKRMSHLKSDESKKKSQPTTPPPINNDKKMMVPCSGDSILINGVCTRLPSPAVVDSPVDTPKGVTPREKRPRPIASREGEPQVLPLFKCPKDTVYINGVCRREQGRKSHHLVDTKNTVAETIMDPIAETPAELNEEPSREKEVKTPSVEEEQSIKNCPPGYAYHEGMCVKKSALQKALGQEITTTETNNKIVCPPGYDYKDGSCKAHFGPSVWKTVCPEGTREVGGACIEHDLRCPDHHDLVDGRCVERTPIRTVAVIVIIVLFIFTICLVCGGCFLKHKEKKDQEEAHRLIKEGNKKH
jgi:hypothetical protein